MQQQRQLRLGDILDDYCPRERRVTNHAVVAMIGEDVKQTRCTTCDADHEYKHAKVPRQRRKQDTPAALYAQVAAGAPKKVAHAAPPANGTNGASADGEMDLEQHESLDADAMDEPMPAEAEAEDETIDIAAAIAEQTPAAEPVDEADEPDEDPTREEGPVHRPLIRASLPRPEGQQPAARPIPEFTIRQPAGRPGGRFRPRGPRPGAGGGGGGGQFQGNRSNGNLAGPPRGMRPGGGRPPQGGVPSRLARRQGPQGPPGRNKRSK